jgi:hypothetical protein
MIANKKLIEKICFNYRVEPTKILVDHILQIYGREPFPHSWTEQDLFEQIRKLILKYAMGESSTYQKALEPMIEKERLH